MKTFKSILFIFVFPLFTFAQGVLPAHRYRVEKVPLYELPDVKASFGFSLRQISSSYIGYAVRVRRSSDNARADIDFDLEDQTLVTLNSTATLVGSGSITTLSAFKGTATLFVEIWYNQSGDPNFNAVQTINSRQPELRFNTAGSGNTKPSVYFNVNHWLEIKQPIENILDGGRLGSFILWTKPEQNKAQFSFGARFSDNWRWSFHINWSDGRVYFDAAERCCAGNRSFVNGANLNQFNTYTFIRGLTYKTARVNSVNTSLNNSTAASVTKVGGEFWLGWNWQGNGGRYEGNLTEVSMFKTDLSEEEAGIIEVNQIKFWN